MLLGVELVCADEVVQPVPEHQQACPCILLHSRRIAIEDDDIHSDMMHLCVKALSYEGAHLVHKLAARAADSVLGDVAQQRLLPF